MNEKKRRKKLAMVPPRPIARKLDLPAGTSPQITTSSGKILLRKRGTRPRRPLSEIVAQIDPESYAMRQREFLNDSPVGKEVW